MGLFEDRKDTVMTQENAAASATITSAETMNIDIPPEVMEQFRAQIEQQRREIEKKNATKPDILLNSHGKGLPNDREFKELIQQLGGLNSEHRKLLVQMKAVIDKAKTEYGVDMTLRDKISNEVSEQIFKK